MLLITNILTYNPQNKPGYSNVFIQPHSDIQEIQPNYGFKQ